MASRTHAAHAVRAGLSVLLLAVAPRFAVASPAWDGMWWSLGGAYSSTKADCRDCAEDVEYVDTGSLIARAGYTMSPRVRLGGEITRTVKQNQGKNSGMTTVSAVTQWNMVRSVPIIIEVGYGIARGSFEIEQNGSVLEVHRNGIALNLGIGSEWPVGPVAIGPYGAMYVGTLGDVQTQTTVARDVLILSWFAGLSVTIP